MKYIRKKYGVYKIFDTHNGASNHWGYKENEHLTILLDEEDIKNSKTADTIEELCDEFIAIYDNQPHFHCLERAKQYADDNQVYGAIWTDIGLIYVAKMNEKGELELI